VVGTRGYGKLRAALLGSVSRALGAKAPCPVVVVPKGTAIPRFIDEAGPARRQAIGEGTTQRTSVTPRKGGALGARRPRTGSR
jgi:hypothetical protein